MTTSIGLGEVLVWLVWSETHSNSYSTGILTPAITVPESLLSSAENTSSDNLVVAHFFFVKSILSGLLNMNLVEAGDTGRP